MKQKFGKLSFVRITAQMPEFMRFFECDCDAIVEGSFLQKYGGNSHEGENDRRLKLYSLFIIREGKVVNCSAWYEEEQLTLLPAQDRDRAEQMIEDYRLRP